MGTTFVQGPTMPHYTLESLLHKSHNASEGKVPLKLLPLPLTLHQQHRQAGQDHLQ